jgi:hypothetical protein
MRIPLRRVTGYAAVAGELAVVGVGGIVAAAIAVELVLAALVWAWVLWRFVADLVGF